MIYGESIGLRAIEKDDLPQLLEWRNKPEWRKFFREHRELNWDQQLAWYNTMVNGDPFAHAASVTNPLAQSASAKAYMFAITDLASKNLLGICGLCYINWVQRNADLSVYIGFDDLYLDSTIAPDVGRTLLRYGFDELGLHRIYLEAYDFDTQRIQFAEGIGLTLEGTMRDTYWYGGAWHNSYWYGLLVGDYKNQINS